MDLTRYLRIARRILVTTPGLAAGLSLGGCAQQSEEDASTTVAAILSTQTYTNCELIKEFHEWWDCTSVWRLYCDNTLTGERELLYEEPVFDGACLQCEIDNVCVYPYGNDDPSSGGGDDGYGGGGECGNDWDCPPTEVCDYGTCIPLGS